MSNLGSQTNNPFLTIPRCCFGTNHFAWPAAHVKRGETGVQQSHCPAVGAVERTPCFYFQQFSMARALQVDDATICPGFLGLLFYWLAADRTAEEIS